MYIEGLLAVVIFTPILFGLLIQDLPQAGDLNGAASLKISFEIHLGYTPLGCCDSLNTSSTYRIIHASDVRFPSMYARLILSRNLLDVVDKQHLDRQLLSF